MLNQDTIREESTDLSNPEQHNPRYYRTWWQKKFAQILGQNLDEPQQHKRSKHFIWRFFSALLLLKRDYPKTAIFLKYFLPMLCLSIIPFVWFVLPSFVMLSASSLLALQIVASLFSVVSSTVIGISHWMAVNVFGEPVKAFDHLYQNAITELSELVAQRSDDGLDERPEIESRDDNSITMKYQSATGQLIVREGYLPKLILQASSHADAGYLEGYMQGSQMEMALTQLNNLYDKIKTAIGAPEHDADLDCYLRDIEQTLPAHFIEEMKAKVQGYNQWRQDSGRPERDNLSYYKYLLLQLLPDAHHYNPFNTANLDDKEPLPHPAGSLGDMLPSPGCTTIAFKLGEYSCYVRVLDWPGYNVAGKSFIEVERAIDGYKKITDSSLSLLSGCVTVLNEHDLLTQINVSRVKKVGPKGMPGAFFIRYLAENAASVGELRALLNDGDEYIKRGPLSGMHVSATDGLETVSLHTEQDPDEGHVLEVMGERPLVVPNFGFDPVNGTLVDHHDSCARLENINYFFKHHPKEEILFGKETEQERLAALREYMSMIMKLNLVNNCESVFVGMYIYANGHLVDARVSTDNHFAGSRAPEEMYQLSIA